MVNKSSLDLAFKSGPYRNTLDKKVKKNNKQFDVGFVEKIEKGLKFSK